MDGISLATAQGKRPQELDVLRQRRLAYFQTFQSQNERTQIEQTEKQFDPGSTLSFGLNVSHQNGIHSNIQQADSSQPKTVLSENSFNTENGDTYNENSAQKRAQHNSDISKRPAQSQHVPTSYEPTRTYLQSQGRQSGQKDHHEGKAGRAERPIENQSGEINIKSSIKTSSFFIESPETEAKQTHSDETFSSAMLRKSNSTRNHVKADTSGNLKSNNDNRTAQTEVLESISDGYDETVERLIQATKKELLGGSVDDDIWNKFRSDQSSDRKVTSSMQVNDLQSEQADRTGVRNRISSFESMATPTSIARPDAEEQSSPSKFSETGHQRYRDQSPLRRRESPSKYSSDHPPLNSSDFSMHRHSMPESYKHDIPAVRYNDQGRTDFQQYPDTPKASRHQDSLTLSASTNGAPKPSQHGPVQHHDNHINKRNAQAQFGALEEFFQSSNSPVPPLKHLSPDASPETEVGVLLQQSNSFSDLGLSTHRPQSATEGSQVTLIVESSGLKLQESLTRELREALGEEKFQQFLTKSVKDLNELQQERLSERSTSRKEKQYRSDAVKSELKSKSNEKKQDQVSRKGSVDKMQGKMASKPEPTPASETEKDSGESAAKEVLGQFTSTKSDKKMMEKLTSNPAYKPKKQQVAEVQDSVGVEQHGPRMSKSVPNLNLAEVNTPESPRPKLNRPKHEPFNIYSEKSSKPQSKEAKGDEKKDSPNSGSERNYEQVSVSRNVVFSSDEIYNQAYGMFPGYPPGMPMSPQQAAMFGMSPSSSFQTPPGYPQSPMLSYPAHTDLRSPLTLSQSPSFVMNPFHGHYPQGQDHLAESPSLRSSFNSEAVPMPHPPPYMAGYYGPDAQYGKMSPSTVPHVPHPPSMEKKSNASGAVQNAAGSFASGHYDQQFVYSPSSHRPYPEAPGVHPGPVSTGFNSMGAGYPPYPYPGMMMAPHPPAPSDTDVAVENTGEGGRVGTETASPEPAGRESLVEESTFTSVSQIVVDEGVRVPHPPSTKKEECPKTTPRKVSMSVDAKRHIDGIRQHHEQKRAEQQEAEDRQTDEQTLEGQRKFAKASLDRYFTSLENLYKSSLKSPRGGDEASDTQAADPGTLDQALKKVSEDIEQLLGPVEDNKQGEGERDEDEQDEDERDEDERDEGLHDNKVKEKCQIIPEEEPGKLFFNSSPTVDRKGLQPDSERFTKMSTISGLTEELEEGSFISMGQQICDKAVQNKEIEEDKDKVLQLLCGKKPASSKKATADKAGHHPVLPVQTSPVSVKQNLIKEGAGSYEQQGPSSRDNNNDDYDDDDDEDTGRNGEDKYFSRQVEHTANDMVYQDKFTHDKSGHDDLKPDTHIYAHIGQGDVEYSRTGDRVSQKGNPHTIHDKVVSEKVELDNIVRDKVVPDTTMVYSYKGQGDLKIDKLDSVSPQKAIFKDHDSTAVFDEEVSCNRVMHDKVVLDKVAHDKVVRDTVVHDRVVHNNVVSDNVFHDKVVANGVVHDKVIAGTSTGYDENDDLSDVETETMVDSVVTGVSIQAGGITERLKEMGIDTTHLKHGAEQRTKDENDNLFVESNKLEEKKAMAKKGKLLLVCPECEGFNKDYMSWCTHCGEMIIGVEPVLVSKNREGKIRKIPVSKDKPEEEVVRTVNVSKFTDIQKPEVIPTQQLNYAQETKESKVWTETLVPKLETLKEPVEGSIQVSPVKSDGKDSGRPSSEEQDLLQNCNRTEQEIAEICENITDPVVKGYIRSHFAKKRQAVLETRDSVDASKSKSKQAPSNRKGKQPLKPKSSKVTPRSNAMNSSLHGDTEESNKSFTVPVPSTSYQSGQGQRQGEGQFSMVPPVPQLYDDDELAESMDTFAAGLPSKEELAIHITTDSMDFSQVGSVDFSNDFSQSIDASKDKDILKKEKIKARRKKKGHGAIDVEVFGYEESRQSRNSSRGQQMVPILDLVGSSDEDDMSTKSDSTQSSVADDSQALEGQGSTGEVDNWKETSQGPREQNQSREGWNHSFEPAREEEQPQLEEEEDQLLEGSEDVVSDEMPAFLEMLIERGAKQKKGKKGQSVSPTKTTKKTVKSKVRTSLEGPAYQRKWARSSTAWSSYNSNELRTSSSLRTSLDGATKRRPNSTSVVRQAELEFHSARDSSTGAASPGVQDKPTRPSSADLYQRKRYFPLAPKVYNKRKRKQDSKKKRNQDYPDVDELPLDTVEHRLPWKYHIQDLLQEAGDKQDKSPDHVASPRSTYDKLIEMTPRIQEGTASVWQCLPDEILLHILAYVDQPDLTRCAQVCQQFYRVAMDETLWKYITLKKKRNLDNYCLKEVGKRHPISLALIHCQGGKVTAIGLRDMFRESAGSLKELNVSCCSLGALTGDSLLLHAAARCHGLTHVDTSWCNVTDSGLIAISNSCHKLESLIINGCQAISNDGFETVIKRHGQSLRHLELFGCFNITPRGLNSLNSNCINLLVLNIGQCYKLTDSCVAQLSSSLGRVETLDLRGCKQIKDNCIRRVVKNCTRLKNLSLANCPYITDVSVLEISTYLSDIRSIDVCGCKNITDGGIRALANTCNNLRDVDISSTGCTHRSVSMLASFCSQRLESLKLNFLADVTESCLIKLAKHCRRLKTLHLYGCTSVRLTSKIKEEQPTFTMNM